VLTAHDEEALMTMNDWQKILVKRKQVDQMKNNNQELYDQLGRAKMYVLRYA
jgi:hypothetical protein